MYDEKRDKTKLQMGRCRLVPTKDTYYVHEMSVIGEENTMDVCLISAVLRFGNWSPMKVSPRHRFGVVRFLSLICIPVCCLFSLVWSKV